MSQIQKKFLKADSVDESKILLLNNGALRARNAADSADVELMKLDSSDVLKVLKLPRIDSALSGPSNAKDLVTKEYVDSSVSTGVLDLIGQPNGIASLDGSGLVPASQLPSYVDDVLEFANLAAFPAVGETGKIYVAIDTSKCYRWSGSTYVYITSGAVDSVNGQTGVVVLDTGDVSEAGDSRYYTAARQAAVEAYADAAVLVEKNRAEAAESAIASDLAQEILDRAADVDAEQLRAETAEGVLAGRASALEAASLQWQPVEKFTLTAPMIAAGYVELSFQAVEHSIMASVDRLMIHHTDDYTVSVVGGKTRLTFVGSLVTPGQEKLAAGDVIRVQACKVAIV